MHDRAAQQRHQCCLAIPCYLAFRFSTERICHMYSNLWSPSYIFSFSNRLNSYSKKNLVTSTDGSYLTFPRQNMLTFLHLHPIFLSPYLLWIKRGLSFYPRLMCFILDFISIRLLQNLMQLILSHSWFMISIWFFTLHVNIP